MPVCKIFTLSLLIFTLKSVLKNHWMLITTTYEATLAFSGHLVLQFCMSFFVGNHFSCIVKGYS